MGNCGSLGFDFKMTAGPRWHYQALPLSTVSSQPGPSLSSALAGPPHNHISSTLHIVPLQIQWSRHQVLLFPAKVTKLTPTECGVLVALTKWSFLSSSSSSHLHTHKSLGIGVNAPVMVDLTRPQDPNTWFHFGCFCEGIYFLFGWD